MSATTDPNAPVGPLPDRVAIETFSEDARAGKVVAAPMKLVDGQLQRLYHVRIEDTVFKVPGDEVGMP